MKNETITPHLRINRALSASLEKRALEWMARRALRWLTSDQLTALGLSAQIGAGAAYALSRYHRYALLLVFNGVEHEQGGAGAFACPGERRSSRL